MILPIAGLVFVIFLLIILSFVWPPDSPWSPWWKINKKEALAAVKLANLKNGETVFELGSGDGEFILAIASKYDVKLVGIEIDPTRFIISWFRAKLSKNRGKIKLVRKDFKNVSLKEADVVFVYLVPRALKRNYPMLKKGLKKGTRIVSYIYEIPDVKCVKKDSKNKLYLYKIT